MSFILDALKKSENARQRQIGPALAELPRRRRQSERPVWAFVVAGLLLVNIGVLALVLMRKKGTDVQPVPTATAAPVPAINPVAQQQNTPPAPAPATVQTPQNLPRSEPLPAPTSVPPPRDINTGMVSSLAQESGMRNDFDSNVSPADQQMLQAISRAQEQITLEDQRAAAARPIQAPAVAPLSGTTGTSPQQQQPQPPPSAGRVIGPNGPQTAAQGTQDEILPTVNELAASGRTFPDMRLDIHSFADSPAERFVFVNMRRYNEGQTLQEGPAVERITAEGVILNQQGLRFLLPRP